MSLILPDGYKMQREQMFAINMTQLLDGINKLEAKEADFKDYVLIVPIDGSVGSWYIIRKDELG